MKQEWFESNDFVKTTSKNKPKEQAQEVADQIYQLGNPSIAEQNFGRVPIRIETN